MIDPTEADLGRRVIYRPRHWDTDKPGEVGVIGSFNDAYVFVHYEPGQGKATRRNDLTWDHPAIGG